MPLEEKDMKKVLDILLGLCYHIISGGSNPATSRWRQAGEGWARDFSSETWRAPAELVKTEFGEGWMIPCKNGFGAGLHRTL